MSDTQKKRATQEQFQWLTAFNKETTEEYAEYTQEVNRLEKKQHTIANAISGYGRALNLLMNEAEDVATRLKSLREERPTRNITAEFAEKFGESYYEIDFQHPEPKKVVKKPSEAIEHGK